MKPDYATISNPDLIGALENELAGILGFAELLQLGSEHRASHASEILESSEHAIQIAREMFHRIERFPAPQACDLNQEVHAASPMLRRIAGRKNELTLRLDSRAAPVHLDRRDLESLLQNLVAAARDAYSERSGPIQIRTVQTTTDSGRKSVILVVEDQAGAVPPGDSRLILEEKSAVSDTTPLSRLFSLVDGRLRMPTEDDSRTRVTIEFPQEHQSFETPSG